MARIGVPRKSRRPEDKKVLKVRNPGNSKGSRRNRRSNNARGNRYSNSRGNGYPNDLGARRPNGPRKSRGSIWSRSSGPKKPRSPKQIILMIVILLAFICGLALGISMIMGPGDSDSGSGQEEFMNVTNNISVYENDSFDLQDENGTQISYYDFDENVTEGQNITAFNASKPDSIY